MSTVQSVAAAAVEALAEAFAEPVKNLKVTIQFLADELLERQRQQNERKNRHVLPLYVLNFVRDCAYLIGCCFSYSNTAHRAVFCYECKALVHYTTAYCTASK